MSIYKDLSTYSGRMNRINYIKYILILLFISSTLGFIGLIPEDNIGQVVTTILFFIITLPINIKRLHDMNKPYYWVFLIVIPYIRFIVLVFLCLVKGSKESNKYGEPDR